jgi:hypothetical protein
MNLPSIAEVSILVPDIQAGFLENARMPEKPNTTWYAQEWMKLRDKRQADLVKELDWPKGKANKVWHGKQRYNEDLVNEIAAWLDVETFELLMRPEDAMRLRAIREMAAEIAKRDKGASEAPKHPQPLKRTA